MTTRSPLCLLFAFALFAGGGTFMGSECLGADGSLITAANVLGKGDTAVLQLVRELTEWKARAEAAEGLLAKAGFAGLGETKPAQPAQAYVLGSVDSERVVIISAGKLSGAVLGSLVSIGDAVVAKVVESRETVAAAVVDQSYKEKIGPLEGLSVRLLVVRP